MKSETPPTVVCDAGPIIHLAELDCLDLLVDFRRILIPSQVREEVHGHRPDAFLRLPQHQVISVVSSVAPEFRQLMDAAALHPGEIAAISLALQERPALLLCDDAAARFAAERLGLRIHGTIGVIIRSMRRGRRTKDEVLELLRQLPSRSSLHIRASLLAEIIEQVKDAQ